MFRNNYQIDTRYMFRDLNALHALANDLMLTTLEDKPYPPTDIVQEDSKFILNFAVAGYKKEHLEVKIDGRDLVVSGNPPKSETTAETKSKIIKNISNKKFTQKYRLPENADVSSVKLEDGILTVVVETPEPVKRARVIEIS